MNDFRVLLIYSGSSIHRKINCQSKRPTCMFRAEKARNSKVSSFMLGIWGYTTCRLSSAIRSSKGSNHPIKRSNINNQNFYFISEQSAVQFLNGPHSLRSLIAGRKLPYHCKNPMNSWSNNHWKCRASTTLNKTKRYVFKCPDFFKKEFFIPLMYVRMYILSARGKYNV